jgi:glycosyltransferase involved in cell wall biosynthesis
MTAGSALSATVIVPTYNEERFIEQCLLSVVEDPGMQVLVVDGGSTDATRDRIRTLMPRLPGLRLIDNPRRTAASAMNLGLTHATGEVIVRLDAHSVYPDGYLRRLIAALEQYGADVCGGTWVTEARRPTAFGRAVAASLTNRWVMGNGDYRNGGGEVRVVDTVPFGCWRAGTLREAGGYNEELIRSQDYDLSRRLGARGARIVLLPDVVIRYQARSGVGENIRYTFFNGYWVGYPLVASGVSFAARHLAPATACLGGLVLLATTALTAEPMLLWLAAPYLMVPVLAAVEAAAAGPAVVLLLPVITAATHVLYGFGTLYGMVRGVLARLRRRAAESPAPSFDLPR